ncbi:MAG: hypothetical protein SOW08_04645 [Lachnospiraceae bacterium]|nr:hypothetical protein [Lachnospiraceae bacterium]
MDTKKVNFTDYQITLEEVMEQFDVSGREMYEDIVDELMEDASVYVQPAGFWREVGITSVSEEIVKLENEEFFSRYLAERLNGVEKAYAFVVTIAEELWQHRLAMSDALEQYLFDAIMKTSLNRAFEKTAEEIVINLPDKAGLFMDNPGHISGVNGNNSWKLADQKQFLSLLQNTNDQNFSIRIDARDHFENSYSLSGIIYAKGIETANCTLCPKSECAHRKSAFDGKALIRRLHESAGSK